MFLIVCFHFSRRLLDRRRHKTNKGRTNRRSLPNCQQNGRIAARHGRLAFRDRAFWQKEGHPAARRRCGRRRSGRRRSTGRWHGGRSATRVYRRRRGCTGGEKEGRQQKGENSGRWHGAGRQGGRGGAPAASARRVGGTSEELQLRAQGGSAERRRRCGRRRRCTGRWHKAGRRNSRGGADGRGGVPAASARRVSGTAEKVRTEEEHRPVARRAAAHKKACAAAGPYPEVRTTLFIIGSVRRGYALQRRESSCRPT